MTFDQIAILLILAATAAMFVAGRWRHDMVALGALLACVATGLVPSGEAFAGFGHPAVITVASILVLSYGLQASGAIDALSDRILPRRAGPTLTVVSLAALAAVLSAFMNNVGALALLMPLAVQVAARLDWPAGRLLMPLAFGSILGGMTTLIGTPPNLIVSGFRAANGGTSFGMFDFTPVGLAVAAAGIAFIGLLGWRLVPIRKGAAGEEFDTGVYFTEARVPPESKAATQRLCDIEDMLVEADAQVVGLVRNEIRVMAPNPAYVVRPGDILVIEADPKALAAALSSLGLELEEAVAPQNGDDEHAAEADAKDAGESGEEGADDDADNHEVIDVDDIVLKEVAVLPNSSLSGRSASDIRLRTTFGVNLLAISRQGLRSMARLRTTAIEPGDVLLLQGTADSIADVAARYGCVPLAERTLRLPDKRRALAAAGTMLAAIAAAALGLVPAAIAFAAGALACVVLRAVPPRQAYEAIDWPVIVLLAALMPVAGAMSSTGAAEVLAHWALGGVGRNHAAIAVALILVVTMTLSDFMNNAATAAVMCPIALGTARALDVSPDPLLMAVAVGASCAFLTPIGHQNNTLILGPGGFRFGDYWRLGLPIEAIVALIGIPMLLIVWPL